MTDAAPAPAPRRGGRSRKFTKEHVLDIALELLATQGLDAVSFRTVSLRLGVDPKALYTYVESKDDLLAAMYDRTLSQLKIPLPDDTRPAVERVVDYLVSVRRALIANPGIFELSRPLAASTTFPESAERLAEIMRDVTADPATSIRLLKRLATYTVGSAVAGAQAAAFKAQQAETLGGNLDPQTHKLTLAYAQEFIESADDDETTFADVIRDMLEHRVGER